MSRYRSDAARLATTTRPARIPARIRELVLRFRASVGSGNQSLKSYGWNFGEDESQSTQELRVADRSLLLVDATTSTKSCLHEFLQQKCFLADAQGRDLFFGERQKSAGRGEKWRIELPPKIW